jgi:hypothetical protein
MPSTESRVCNQQARDLFTAYQQSGLNRDMAFNTAALPRLRLDQHIELALAVPAGSVVQRLLA